MIKLAETSWLTPLLLSCGLALAQGCSTTPQGSMEGSESYPANAEIKYKASLERWSGDARSYDGFATTLILKGTLVTPCFQEAWGEEQARLSLMPPEEREATVRDALRDIHGVTRVVIAASSPKHPNMALTKPSSIWKLRLYDDSDNWAAPISIVAYPTRSRLEPSISFPYITRWDDAYIADFPAAPRGSDRPFLGSSNSQVTLQLAGEPGAAELQWQVSPELVASERPMPTPFPEPTPPAAPLDTATPTQQ